MSREPAKQMAVQSPPLLRGAESTLTAGSRRRHHGWPLFGGAAAVIGASACCLGPLVLVSLGVSGAWIANLTALEPYRPIFIGLAVLFLAFAYRQIYRRAPPDACEPASLCASPRTERLYKTLFWSVTVLALAALAFPYFIPYFY